MTVGSLLPPPIRTIASNLARRRRKIMGSSPISGSCFLLRFLRSFCRVLLGFFLLLFCPQRFSASGSLPFFCHSLPFSHLYFLLPHTSCTPHLSDVLCPPTRVLYLSPDREHRLRQAAQTSLARVLPLTSLLLLPLVFPVVSGRLLLSSRLLSLILCLLLSSSPYRPFFSAPVLLSSSPSSPPLLLSAGSSSPSQVSCTCSCFLLIRLRHLCYFDGSACAYVHVHFPIWDAGA